MKLFDALAQLLEEILATGWIEEVIIDGSFVTSKAEPNDVDIIPALLPEFKDAQISFWQAKILDARFLSKKYRFDVKVETAGSRIYFERLDFFQEVKDSDERKGVVRLVR